MTPVTLRRAGPNDTDYLIAATERLADFPVPSWRTASQIAQADRRILLEAVARPGDRTLVLIADQAGTPVGCLFATTTNDYFDGAPVAHVEVVVVSREAQGLGVGRILLDGAEQWARARGYSRITLNAFSANLHARAVYEHLGYAPEIVTYLKVL
ncbi:MAG: GNAT family N-acetyltransferase [Gemmatimonadetes bacterium]|nr:GNAT family N-acetyltransferase [Gemmatimonadota bacterium]